MDNIHERVAAFGMRSEACFGNDAVLAYQVLKEAFAHARSGAGPCFIEFYTYRWTAHVGPESDDNIGYRLPGAADFWRRHCPLEALERLLADARLLDPEGRQKIVREVDEEIDDALAFARRSPFPGAGDYISKNLATHAPLADRLLKEGVLESFDGYQPDAILAPY